MRLARPRKFAVLLATALATVSVAGPAAAWGALGHRLVGELAERHLDPRARAEVAQLLQGEADPSLAGVSNWADELRTQDPERFKATSRWHYINAEGGGCAFDVARDCPADDCVVAALEAQRLILADRSQPLAARRDALKFIVHFVGDVHQPMHAGDRDDSGGNRFQVSLRTPLEPEAYARKNYVDGVMGTNLHSVWDFYVLAGLFGRESCRLIEARALYPAQPAIDHGYLDSMRPLAEQRLRQAAWRLAQLLDQTLAR